MIYLIEDHPRNNKLIENGEMIKFALLPITAQNALIHYMSVDGAAWAVEKDWEDWKWGEGKPNTPEMREEALKDIEKFRSRFIEEFGEELFGYAEIDANVLHDSIKLDEDYEDSVFDAAITRKEEYEIPTWPVILSPYSYETLQDGWHRFHQYMKHKIEKIPVIWYAD